MEVSVGQPGESPSLSYQIKIPNGGPSGEATPEGAAPSYAQWVKPSENFINTGRDQIIVYDYFFDARCGEVGFRPNGPDSLP
ncbi:MAG TPA: hypothetical protein VJ728_17210 [Candidatus Binataceae bacterium]|nr:hypothetical protein [Candidatus Binataceae bacterium]